MDRVPFIYNHPDVPELAPKAFVMMTASFSPLIFGLVCVILCASCDRNDYMPLALLFLIPFGLMLFVAKRKLDEMYYVAKNRSLDEANAMFGKAMVAEVYAEVPAIILLMVLVLLIMM